MTKTANDYWADRETRLERHKAQRKAVHARYLLRERRDSLRLYEEMRETAEGPLGHGLEHSQAMGEFID